MPFVGQDRVLGAALGISLAVHGVLITGAAMGTKGAAEAVEARMRDSTAFVITPPFR